VWRRQHTLDGRVLRPAAGTHLWAPAGRLQGQPGAGVHHGCSPRVDRRDDLLGGDALQVGAGRRQVGGGRAGAGSAAAGSPRAAAPQRGHAGAGAAPAAGAPRRQSPCGAARAGRRCPTTYARGWVRRSRTTALRRGGSPARPAKAAMPTTPTGPCRPRAADRSFRGGRESTRGADPDRSQQAPAPR